MPPQVISARTPSTSGRATRSQALGRSRDGQAMRGRPQRCSINPMLPVAETDLGLTQRESRGESETAMPARGFARPPVSGYCLLRHAVTVRAMILDLERLRAAPLQRDPFDFVVVDNFLRADDVPALIADFPAVHG